MRLGADLFIPAAALVNPGLLVMGHSTEFSTALLPMVKMAATAADLVLLILLPSAPDVALQMEHQIVEATSAAHVRRLSFLTASQPGHPQVGHMLVVYADASTAPEGMRARLGSEAENGMSIMSCTCLAR